MPSLSELIRSLSELEKNLIAEIEKAEMATATEARRVAILQFSSGTNTLDELAEAGHPYATRAPNPAYTPAVINGNRMFREDWQQPEQHSYGGHLVTMVVNTDPNTEYLFGTSKMVDRSGMLEQIEILMQPTREKNLAAAIDAAIRAS